MSENKKPVAAEMQDKPAPAETLTCCSCKECRGYKFCASRSRDYPCSLTGNCSCGSSGGAVCAGALCGRCTI